MASVSEQIAERINLGSIAKAEDLKLMGLEDMEYWNSMERDDGDQVCCWSSSLNSL